jgi:hypothetical protein
MDSKEVETVFEIDGSIVAWTPDEWQPRRWPLLKVWVILGEADVISFNTQVS